MRMTNANNESGLALGMQISIEGPFEQVKKELERSAS